MKAKILLGMFGVVALVQAKPVIELTQSNEETCVYSCGDMVRYTVALRDDEDKPLPPVISVKITNDNGRVLRTSEYAGIPSTSFIATMSRPGFMNVVVSCNYKDADGKDNVCSETVASGFEPQKITTGMKRPADFMTYWKDEIKKADENIPLDVKMEKMDRFSNENHTAYKISFAAPDGRVYGFLCVPTAAGRHPAIVSVPGAGPGCNGPDANDNFVTLNMNVFNHDTVQEGKTAKELYDELNKDGIYMYHGGYDREKTFFHRPIVGISRAVEWLATQDFVDSSKIGYNGSSQGGAFAFILGGLTGRFAYIVANVPAMCDQYGEAKNRTSGWPKFKRNFKFAKEADAMVPYYDSAFFASYIKCPIRVIVGFIDATCPPSAVYAAFNGIPSKDKKIIHELHMGHSTPKSYSNEIARMRSFLLPADKK